MVCLSSLLVVLSSFSLAYGQYSVADWTLPGFAQWQTDLRNHARTEGRPHDTRNHVQLRGRSYDLIKQDTQDKAKKYTLKGSSQLVKTFTQAKDTTHDLRTDAQFEGSLYNLIKKAQTEQRQNDLTKHTHAERKLLNIVDRGNKMEKTIRNLLKISRHNKRETFNHRNAKSELSKHLLTETGLNVIIRQIIQNKLKRLQEEAQVEKSAVQLLLEQSSKKESFLDKTVGRSGSFLDRLIEVMKDETGNEESFDLPENRNPKVLTLFDETDDEQDELLSGLKFFTDAGLLRTELDYEDEVTDTVNEGNTFSNDDDGLLQKELDNENEVIDTVNEGNIFSNIFADSGLLQKELDDEIRLIDTANKVNTFSNIKNDVTESFLDEELDAAESETEILTDQIAELLVELEAKQGAEHLMMAQSQDVIRSKLRRFPTHMLLKDRDFIDSVFFRFAMMKLPLRTADIDVSESFQINKVLHNNIAKASAETRSLLQELRNDEDDGNDGRERAKAIDESRRELQKLLKIVS